MPLATLKRLGFAAWLVAIALIANLAAQNQLSINVVEATVERAVPSAQPADPHAHHAAHDPDAGAHDHGTSHHDTLHHGASHHDSGHHGAGGHTHKGHADCAVCGVVAVMAALTLPAALVVDSPRDFAAAEPRRIAEGLRAPAGYSPYASRAPPISL